MSCYNMDLLLSPHWSPDDDSWSRLIVIPQRTIEGLSTGAVRRRHDL